jgi:hypothetical protein
MKTLLSIFSIFMLMISLAVGLQAQIGSSYYSELAVDSTVNTETITYDLTPRALNNLYYYGHEIRAVNQSGTSAANVIIEQSNSGTNWSQVDTFAVSGSTTIWTDGYLHARYQRARIVSSNTGVTYYYLFPHFRRRD